MTDPATPREALLDRFVENLRPPSHKTVGVPPTSFDLSLTEDDLYGVGAALLREYDAAGHPPPSAPEPIVKTVSPGTVEQNGPSFILTVAGEQFSAKSVIRWNGVDRATTVKNETALTASIPATDLLAPGAMVIDVVTPRPGGGTSNALHVTVTPAPPKPPPPPVQTTPPAPQAA